MSRENNKVPRLRFPEFRDAGDWEEKRLGEVCKKISQGGTPDTSNPDYWGGDIEWLTPAEMGKMETRFIASTNRRITETGLQKCSSDLLPINSVILSTRAPIGHLLINLSEMAINQGCKGLVPETTTDYSFLYYHLFEQKRVLTDLGSGSTFKELSARTLKNFQILIPTLPEQQKIADCLSSLDDLITAQTQKLAHLKTHKKGLMQQLFPAEGETVPKLRFPEFRDAGDWEEREVGELFRVTRGDVLSMMLVKERECETSLFPVYSSQTKNNGLSGYYSEYLYENAITWTTDGANAGDVNFRKGKFFCTNVCGVLLNPDGYANTFVAELLNSVTKKHVSYVGNPKLMNGVMAKITIPFPTLPEQQKIADCLSSLDELITAQTQKLAQLKTHKKGLMQQLFPAADEVNG